MPLVKVATKDRSSCGAEPASAMRCCRCVCSGWQSLEELESQTSVIVLSSAGVWLCFDLNVTEPSPSLLE